jgi:hypothetical protein
MRNSIFNEPEWLRNAAINVALGENKKSKVIRKRTFNNSTATSNKTSQWFGFPPFWLIEANQTLENIKKQEEAARQRKLKLQKRRRRDERKKRKAEKSKISKITNVLSKLSLTH